MNVLFRAALAALLLFAWFAVLHTWAASAPASDAGRRIAELRREIARHDAAYRNAAPEISDVDYDQLRQKLALLENDFPESAKAVPPLPALADDRSGLLPTVRHRERMLSLEKAYTETELRAFHARVSRQLGAAASAFVIEPKFDGLAVSVTYEHGKFVRAVTRGDGVEGDDVSAHVRLISDVPRELQGHGWPTAIEVRGEVYVPLEEFARVNAERELMGGAPFANPRNLAAGTLRQLEPQEAARRGLRAVFFAVGACEPLSALPPTQHELPACLRDWGLPAIEPHQIWPAQTADDVVRAMEECRQARARFAFPTDGAVVKLDALAGQRELGAGESAPRWAVAFKFAPERVETQVRAITLQVGRSGVLTPVAELAPIVIAGSTITRATLHNRDEIARKDIRVGDTVIVEKAGEIVPAIVGVNLARRPASAPPYLFPTSCPECGAAVTARKDEVAVRCTNDDCSAQLRRRLEHFASKACVDITGLGPAMIDSLVQTGKIRDLPDLYRLSLADFLTPTKNPGKLTAHLLDAIEKSRRAELWRFIHGLGIPQVGASAARDLALRFGSLEALAEAGKSNEPDDAATRAARTFFSVPKNRALVANLLAAGVQPSPPNVPITEATLAGKVFVLTGTLPTLTRAQAIEKIEAAGGKVASNVTRNTHVVVAGADPGAKLDQAKKLGVLIVDEARLLRMLGEK